MMSSDEPQLISTHAPAGGATRQRCSPLCSEPKFLLTPLREGRLIDFPLPVLVAYFYSRPCGRGDQKGIRKSFFDFLSFLLTPLREGRPDAAFARLISCCISTHAPAGGATGETARRSKAVGHFYSRPCGRGDCNFPQVRHEVLRQIAER